MSEEKKSKHAKRMIKKPTSKIKKYIRAALESKNVLKVQKFIEKYNCNIIVDKDLNYNLLMWMIAFWPDFNLMKMIISKNINLSLVSTDGECNTALTMALRRCSILDTQFSQYKDLVISIIAHKKCNPGHVDNTSQTALMLALNMDLIDIARVIISKNGLLVNPGHVDINTGNTAFIMAVTKAEEQTESTTNLVRELMELGDAINPGHVNEQDNTALLIATEIYVRMYVKKQETRLLDHVIIQEIINIFKEKCNPWHVAKGNRSVLKYMCNFYSYSSAFLISALNFEQVPPEVSDNQFYIMANFLQKCSRNVLRDSYAELAFYYIFKNPSIAKNIKNLDEILGEVFMKAVSYNYQNYFLEAIVNTGFDCKVSLDYVDNKNDTPLIIACKTSSHLYASEMLRLPQLSINYEDDNRKTAYEYACESKMFTVANQIHSIINPIVMSCLVPENLLLSDLAKIVCSYVTVLVK